MRFLTIAMAFLATPAWAQEIDLSGHDAVPVEPMAVAAEVGDAPAPSVSTDHAADRIWPVGRMAAARAALMDESRFSTTTLRIDRLEYRAVDGRDGYGWDAEAAYGGDIDRFVLATEGEGGIGRAAERAELRALWRHAVDPWWNLEAGVRHDFRPDPERTYATIGIMGLAPYWLEVEGQLLVSTKGDVHLRADAGYDQRITQRLILEPEVEIDAALQDVPDLRVGAGFERIELGFRLRYQLARRFAPYIGVHWESRLGETANLARAAGERPSGLSAILGIRSWF
jgi:copper resistance protein B